MRDIQGGEKPRVMCENLNGTDSSGLGIYGDALTLSEWEDYSKPAYDARRDVYLNDRENFVCDVNWPINSSTGWFRELSIQDVEVNVINSTTVEISWTTPGYETDCEVRWTDNSAWWAPYGPVGLIYDGDKNTSHTKQLTYLDPNITYEFRIRSTNDTNSHPDLSTQKIWGYVGSFKINP